MRLAQALTDNVALLACENTMVNTKTTRADMYGGISYVTAGVTHLIEAPARRLGLHTSVGRPGCERSAEDHFGALSSSIRAAGSIPPLPCASIVR